MHGDIVIYEEDQLTRSLMQEWLGDAGYRVRLGSLRAGRRPAGGSGDRERLHAQTARRGMHARHPRSAPWQANDRDIGPIPARLGGTGAAARRLGVHQVVAKPLMRDELLDVRARCIIG